MVIVALLYWSIKSFASYDTLQDQFDLGLENAFLQYILILDVDSLFVNSTCVKNFEAIINSNPHQPSFCIP